jgi:hypothetical protein
MGDGRIREKRWGYLNTSSTPQPRLTMIAPHTSIPQTAYIYAVRCEVSRDGVDFYSCTGACKRDAIAPSLPMQKHHQTAQPRDDDASGSLPDTPRPVRKLSRPSKQAVGRTPIIYP